MLIGKKICSLEDKRRLFSLLNLGSEQTSVPNTKSKYTAEQKSPKMNKRIFAESKRSKRDEILSKDIFVLPQYSRLL